jgi:hypothetical protein
MHYRQLSRYGLCLVGFIPVFSRSRPAQLNLEITLIECPTKCNSSNLWKRNQPISGSCCNPFIYSHGRMASATGSHGLPKFSPGPAMPYLSTPCGRATSETASLPFQEWPACKAGGLRLSSTPLDAPLMGTYVYSRQ